MKYISADLHMHTKNSDWEFSQKELEAIISNLEWKKVFSITDHNYLTVNNYYEVNWNLCIPGIEISAVANNEPVHILWYSLNPKINNNLQKILDDIRKWYQNRAKKIHKKIKNAGFNIAPLSEIRDPNLPLPIQKSDFVKELWRISWLKNSREIRDRARNNWNLLFVLEEVFFPEVEDLIPIMKESNFLTVWAHPWKKLFCNSKDKEKSTNILNHIINSGIDWIESFYHNHTSEQTELFLCVAEKNKLLITWWWDFHWIWSWELSFPLSPEYIDSFLNKL